MVACIFLTKSILMFQVHKQSTSNKLSGSIIRRHKCIFFTRNRSKVQYNMFLSCCHTHHR
ncbi:hypothetical protein HanPSC8_Chr02g0064451 [Helianthus annuus]|nr:hypothetical protein HanPSC8_Chr02g0064451 [Helianthus annuus]